MALLGRLVLALLLVGAAFVLDAVGVLDSIDRVLLDSRFALTNRAASDNVAVVEIDSRSLAEVGVWPWPRAVHAQLLDRLMALDAGDVAFDIDFSSASDSVDDKALADALDRAGGFAHLAALEQNASAGSGEVRVNMPLPQLAAKAQPVNVNVDLDRQGRIVSFPAEIETAAGTVPALALALADVRPAAGRTIYIDYGIDLRQIDRISATDVLDGSVDPARIAGKQVIIGASAIELRDQFTTPRFGLVPGALAQAEALESIKAGRGLSHLGILPELILSLALVLIGVVKRPTWNAATMGAVTISVIVAIEGSAWLLQLYGRVIVPTAGADLSTLCLTGLWVVEELRAEYERRRAAQRRIAYLASHDVVTGSLSRQGLVDHFADTDQRLTILLVGIRRLDLVRGALGHDVAKQALAQIARTLDEMVIATLAVVDRDIFALAWDGPVGRDEIDHHCDRIRLRLDQAFETEGHAIFVDTEFASASSAGIEAALRQAELALAETGSSTRAGRFTPALEARVIARRRIDSALRKAIEEGGISVQYQPQIRLRDGRLVGVEALARWEDPELGAVPPSEFIPLAEETGLIVRLGELILREACRQAAQWDWNGTVAVNLSPAQMQLSDVVAMVDEALARSGLPAQRLDLEVTESLLVHLDGQTAAQLKALRARHVGLAIDDFGTGYSSFSYLAELDCDKIKIDRSFLSSLVNRPQSALVVRSIIDLAHCLGRTVVAEGIENEAQLALLRALGCDTGQGYLLGKAVPAARILDIIAVDAKGARQIAS